MRGKAPFLSHFSTKYDPFTKTGSEQTQEKLRAMALSADCEDELDRELLRKIFDEVDVDCSGAVTLSELEAHRRRNEEMLRNKRRDAFHEVRLSSSSSSSSSSSLSSLSLLCVDACACACVFELSEPVLF